MYRAEEEEHALKANLHTRDMPSATWEFGMDIVELKEQRCARRSASFSKDKAKDRKRSGASSCANRTYSVGPVGSDFAHPRRMARTAGRTGVAKDQIQLSSDMPQISLGRKPSATTTLNFQNCQQESVREEKSAEEQHRILVEVEEERLAVMEAIRLHWAATVQKNTAEEMGTGNEPSELSVAGIGDDYGTASAPLIVPDTCATSLAPFEGNLDDALVFPGLAASQQTLQIQQGSKTFPLDPAEASSTQTNDQTVSGLTLEQGPSANEGSKEESLEDWVVVSSDKSDDALLTATKEIYDTQLSSHTVAKQCEAHRAKSKSKALDIDWSQDGIPREVTRQLIHGSMNPSHRSIHAKPIVSPPLSALRQLNIGSSRRQLSAPRTPRSQSKSRLIQQPVKKR
jgi:hypothetical protein